MSEKSRRDFIKLASVGAAGVALQACGTTLPEESDKSEAENPIKSKGTKPIVVSTWKHGLKANEAAWKILANKGYALDAVESGVRVSEDDPEERSVGYGGRPDREGKVTLDACIMNELYDCGAVAFLEDIKNPISVARKVMTETAHVMLVGEGAKQFALEQGFEQMNLLIPESEKDWKEWLKKSEYKPVINIENHDTIGMLALDEKGRLSGACTTSGAAYKLHGRVGDSPIVGAGLYVDGEVGAACATGLGEAVIRACGSHLIVQLMKQGYHPEDACKEAIEHLHKIHKNVDGMQVGFLALTLDGVAGGYSMYNGFNYACHTSEGNSLIECQSKLKWSED
jgi:isoaspartyl peptidase/L-asparaginase-like protein (Ntn-hydrolase superfamily)